MLLTPQNIAALGGGVPAFIIAFDDLDGTEYILTFDDPDGTEYILTAQVL